MNLKSPRFKMWAFLRLYDTSDATTSCEPSATVIFNIALSQLTIMQLLLCNLWFTISPCLSSKKPKTFTQWRDALKDRVAAARITARLDKLHFGHFGDVKPVGEGVWEMKINVGAGYRAYYVLRDGALILLLCGGNKRTQSRDIEKAIAINNAITDEDIGALP